MAQLEKWEYSLRETGQITTTDPSTCFHRGVLGVYIYIYISMCEHIEKTTKKYRKDHTREEEEEESRYLLSYKTNGERRHRDISNTTRVLSVSRHLLPWHWKKVLLAMCWNELLLSTNQPMPQWIVNLFGFKSVTDCRWFATVYTLPCMVHGLRCEIVSLFVKRFTRIFSISFSVEIINYSHNPIIVLNGKRNWLYYTKLTDAASSCVFIRMDETEEDSQRHNIDMYIYIHGSCEEFLRFSWNINANRWFIYKWEEMWNYFYSLRDFQHRTNSNVNKFLFCQGECITF